MKETTMLITIMKLPAHLRRFRRYFRALWRWQQQRKAAAAMR
jgi:hypothetical protein